MLKTLLFEWWNQHLRELQGIWNADCFRLSVDQRMSEDASVTVGALNARDGSRLTVEPLPRSHVRSTKRRRGRRRRGVVEDNEEERRTKRVKRAEGKRRRRQQIVAMTSHHTPPRVTSGCPLMSPSVGKVRRVVCPPSMASIP